MERGLRQGDSISPFLFLLVAEALQVSILDACNKGFFKGVSLADDGSNGKRMNVCIAWLDVMNKIRDHLCSWKAKSLSIEGFNKLVAGVTSGSNWIDIINAILHIEWVDPSFKSSFIRKVSNGKDTCFWKDAWCNEGSKLMDLYPWLYALKNDKDCKISVRWCHDNGTWGWKWNWRSSDLSSLLISISTLDLTSYYHDKWCWTKDASASILWLPIRDNLLARGVPVSSICCPFCEKVDEYAHHCLLLCPCVKSIWMKVWSWWHIDTSSSYPVSSIRDIASENVNNLGSQILNKILHAVYQCVLWSIWKSRNTLVNAPPDTVDKV
ncbi:hypothetical protein Tco_0546360 [Tanacetum coccineum]